MSHNLLAVSFSFFFFLSCLAERQKSSKFWLTSVFCLRDCVPIFSRLSISDEQVSELRGHCTNYLLPVCFSLKGLCGMDRFRIMNLLKQACYGIMVYITC